MKRVLIFVFVVALFLSAQDWIGHSTLYSSPPTGSCSPREFGVDRTAGGVYICPDSGTWPSIPNIGGHAVPSGAILLIASGSCPSGFTEATTLNGKMLRGTLAANGDVGTTGGNSTITPAGTNSTTTTGATSAGTPAGTNSATATSGNCAATNIAAGTGSATACKATAPNLAVPSETFTGSAMSTHTHTVPAETFTGTPIDPSPPYVKVIFCSAN